MDDEARPLHYAVRIGARAERDIALAIAHFLESDAQFNGGTDGRIALAWQEGLFLDLAGLADNPRRFPAWRAGYFRGDVRQKIYRRTSASVAYRLLFLVEDQTLDGPRVTLLHIRHGTARPLSRDEALTIEAQNETT